MRAVVSAGPAEAHARSMDGQELRQVAASGLVEIGSHTHGHPFLEYLSLDERRFELVQSRRLLEEAVGRPVTSLAYPNGSVGKGTVQLVHEAGYRLACESRPDVARGGGDPFRVPRFWVGDLDGEAFGRWLGRWLAGGSGR